MRKLSISEREALDRTAGILLYATDVVAQVNPKAIGQKWALCLLHSDVEAYISDDGEVVVVECVLFDDKVTMVYQIVHGEKIPKID